MTIRRCLAVDAGRFIEHTNALRSPPDWAGDVAPEIKRQVALDNVAALFARDIWWTDDERGIFTGSIPASEVQRFTLWLLPAGPSRGVIVPVLLAAMEDTARKHPDKIDTWTIGGEFTEGLDARGEPDGGLAEAEAWRDMAGTDALSGKRAVIEPIGTDNRGLTRRLVYLDFLPALRLVRSLVPVELKRQIARAL